MNNVKAEPGYSRTVILIIAVVVATAVVFLYQHGIFAKLELASLDLRYSFDRVVPRLPSGSEAVPGIVFIDLPKTDSDPCTTLPYEECSNAIKILAYSGAKTVVLSSVLSKPQESTQDLVLAVSIKTSNVYVPVLYDLNKDYMERFYTGKGVLGVDRPLPLFIGKNVASGHINAFADIDGRLRRAPAVIRYAGKYTYQFGLKIAFDMLGVSEDSVEFDPAKHALYFSDPTGYRSVIPLDKDNRIVINWGDLNEKNFSTISYKDLLEAYSPPIYVSQPAISLSAFKDKICIIGSDGPKIGSSTPRIKHNYATADSCGAVISNVFRNDFVRELPQPVNIAVIFLVSLIFGASISNRRILGMAMTLLAGAVFLIVISAYGLPKNLNLILIFFFIALSGITLSRFQIFSGLLFTLLSALLYLIISAGAFRIFNLSVVTFYPAFSIMAIFVFFSIYMKIAEYFSRARLFKSATRDPLTSLYNRRHFNILIDAELEASRANRSRKLSVLMCDIDNFKKINDTYGHPAGDTVLKAFAGIITANCRKSDSVARYGGEEFIVLFTGTSTLEAFNIAERIRKSAEAKQFVFKNESYGTTLSMGIAEFSGEASKEDLIEKADQALYRAKNEGKNRVYEYK